MCQRNENETESTRNWEQWLWMYKHINLPMLQLSYTKIKLDPTYMSKKWKWEKKLKSSSAITSALTWKCFDYHALLKLSSIVIHFLVLHFGEAWLVFWDPLWVWWVGNRSHMVGGFAATSLGSSSLSLCSPSSGCNILLGRGQAIAEINSIDSESSSSLTFPN